MIYHKGHKEHKADLPNALNRRILISLDFGAARGAFVLFVLFVVNYQTLQQSAKKRLSPGFAADALIRHSGNVPRPLKE